MLSLIKTITQIGGVIFVCAGLGAISIKPEASTFKKACEKYMQNRLNGESRGNSGLLDTFGNIIKVKAVNNILNHTVHDFVFFQVGYLEHGSQKLCFIGTFGGWYQWE